MKWIGIAILFLGAYLATCSYRERLRVRARLLVGYRDFVREMRSRASNYLEPVSRWAGGFVSDALEESGFLPSVRAGERICDAFSHASRGLDKVVTDALSELFSHTGACLADEVGRIDRALEVLEESAEVKERECEERARLFSVLTVAVCLGVTVLVI